MGTSQESRYSPPATLFTDGICTDCAIRQNGDPEARQPNGIELISALGGLTSSTLGLGIDNNLGFDGRIDFNTDTGELTGFIDTLTDTNIFFGGGVPDFYSYENTLPIRW